MAGILWSDEEERVLKKLLDSGVQPCEIPQIIKSRTLNSIYNKMQANGWKCKTVEPDIDYQAFRILTGGGV